MGAGLAARLLLDGGQQGHAAGPGKILEPVVEGDQAGALPHPGPELHHQILKGRLTGEQHPVGAPGVGRVLLRVIRVRRTQARQNIARHDPGVGRVHPVVGVPVAVVVAVVAVVVLVVVVGQALQQLHPR